MLIKNKFPIFIISILITFLIIESLYLYVLPKVIDVNAHLPLITKTYHEKTGNEILVDNLQLKTFADFSFSLNAKKLQINNKNKENVVSIQNVSLRVPLFPLIFKEINIKNISANDLRIKAERYSNGKYSLEDLIFQI